MENWDWNEVDKLINEGYISKRKHPDFDLWIYNYTNKAQYDWFWNKYTIHCRGLIVGANKELISRPLPKFFSYDQLINQNESYKIPDLPFKVFDKPDGYLGVSYQVNGKTYISTRGSFESPMAIVANRIYQEKYSSVELDPNITYLFEIIYPEGKLIVDYGNKRDLILLAMVETQTGDELPLEEAPGGLTTVEEYHNISNWKTLLETTDGTNKEGFVIVFENNFRLKLKYEEYRELVRLQKYCSPKEVYKLLSEGSYEKLNDIMELCPSHIKTELIIIRSKMLNIYYEYEYIASMYTRGLRDKFGNCDDKIYAEELGKDRYKNYRFLIFNMLKNKDYSKVLWRKVRKLMKGN
jgi:hypothetical protein